MRCPAAVPALLMLVSVTVGRFGPELAGSPMVATVALAWACSLSALIRMRTRRACCRGWPAKAWRSMVVDPPNGRIPVREEAVAIRNNRLINLTDTWMNHTPWERCITRGVPGGIFPPGYGAGYRILQTPGYVVILYEMICEARIIPLDGRSHVGDSIRQWNGDSRGRWEGNILVVEVTNYNDKGTIATNIATRGARGLPRSEALQVVERFTITDANTINYEVTIEDPDVYTAPWKVAMPLN